MIRFKKCNIANQCFKVPSLKTYISLNSDLFFCHYFWWLLAGGGAGASLMSKGGWLCWWIDYKSQFNVDPSNCSPSPAISLVLSRYHKSPVFGLWEKTSVPGLHVRREKNKKRNPSFYLPEQQENFQLCQRTNKSIGNVRGKYAPIHKVISPKINAHSCSHWIWHRPLFFILVGLARASPFDAFIRPGA